MRGNVLQILFPGNVHHKPSFSRLGSGRMLAGVFRRILAAALLVTALAGIAAAQLTISAPVPATQTANVGDTVLFTVNTAGQQAGHTYQYIWQFSPSPSNPDYVPLTNGARFSGVSSPTLIITNAQATDSGRFRCLLNELDSTGAYTANLNSGPGYLTVNVPQPPAVTQPGPQTVIRGNSASFSVTATGQGTFSYQWQVSIPAGATFVNLNDNGRVFGSTTATLQIQSVLPGDAGWYRCLVSNAGGQSNSGRATLTVLASPPSNLSASPFSSTAVNLSWTNTDPDAVYVVIERALGNTGAFSTLVQASAQLTSYQDPQASPATTYTYRAYAMYSTDSLTGTHAYSNQTSATTLSATLPPTGLLATPVTSSQINLTWTNQDPTATAVVIERQSLTVGAATPFVQIASLSGQATSYQDTNNGAGLPSQVAFNYRAYAVSPRGNSAYSNTSETTTLAPPATPQAFTATAASSTEIDLSWSNSDPTVSSYLIQRATGNGSFSNLITVTAPALFYQDTTVVPATQYTYRMSAQSPTGASVYTSAITLTSGPAPLAPTNFTATGVSPVEIDLRWRDPSGGYAQIQIDRKQDGRAAWIPVATLQVGATAYSDLGVTTGASYTYRIYTLDQTGVASAQVFVYGAQPGGVPAPTNFIATNATTSRLDLQWTNAYSGYTAIHVYENGPNDFRFKIADLLGTATTYEITNLPTNSNFSFALQAEVSGILSPFTSDLLVTIRPKVTIFFVHGTGQSGGALDALASAVQSVLDPNGDKFIFDAGFDWSRCTVTGGVNQRFPFTPLPTGEDGVPPPPHPPGVDFNPCPNKCNVTDGAVDLSRYIASKNPPGDVFVVSYSLGGNVSRDMIEGQPGSGIGQPGRKLLGFVTLGSGSNGYPYEYPWDNLALCDGLAKEIASDIRGTPYYPYSNYVPSINNNWLASPLGGAGYQTFPWMVAAGTFCKSPIRFPDSTQNGCPSGSSNDGIVCADSALFNNVAGGTFNRPTNSFASDAYSHTADSDWISQTIVFDRNNGDRSAFYNGHCDMRQAISLWNPGAGTSLVQQLTAFIQANTP